MAGARECAVAALLRRQVRGKRAARRGRIRAVARRTVRAAATERAFPAPGSDRNYPLRALAAFAPKMNVRG